MRPAISEFSYGYAVTEEIIKRQRAVIIGAPIFPSLLQEGRPGGGYDLKIDRVGFPLFIQFKLSHKMQRNNSFEIKNHSLFSPPFYRIHLMPLKHSQQHDMLLALDDGKNQVYYVAPFFSTQNEINSYYSTGSVLHNSVFIRPTTIGNLPDKDEHHISLKQHDKFGYLFSSEPRRIDGLTYSQEFLTNINNRLESDDQVVDLRIEVVTNRMLTIINERSNYVYNNFIDSLYGIPPSLGLLTYLSRYYFGCEVLLVLK